MRKGLLTAAVAVSGLLATGCGAATAGAPQATSAGPSTSASGSAQPAPSPSTTIGSKSVTFDGDKMSLEVYRVERRGGLVVMDFGARNLSEGNVDNRESYAAVQDKLGRGGVYDVGAVSLVDPEGKKKYLPARYDGECLCSKNLKGRFVAPGRTMEFTATYADVPEDVTTVDVTFASYGSVTGVTIS